LHGAVDQHQSAVPAVIDESGDALGDQPVKRRHGRPPGKRNAATPLAIACHCIHLHGQR
jgi:hypothetical protein